MKNKLLDLIAHTSSLGGIELIKITGTDAETHINTFTESRSVILSGKFKNVDSEFKGVFGMPNLGKLRTILSFDDYNENSSIVMTRQQRDDADVPVAIHFETQDKSFINDYRLMSQAIVEEKIKQVKFAGAKWDIDFVPQAANIQRMKKQSQANNEETVFTAKVDGGDLKIFFGDVSTHSGNFVFEPKVNGNLARAWSWPVKEFLSIMDLVGDKRVYISDQGVMRITVDSGIAEYEYLLPSSR